MQSKLKKLFTRHGAKPVPDVTALVIDPRYALGIDGLVENRPVACFVFHNHGYVEADDIPDTPEGGDILTQMQRDMNALAEDRQEYDDLYGLNAMDSDADIARKQSNFDLAHYETLINEPRGSTLPPLMAMAVNIPSHEAFMGLLGSAKRAFMRDTENAPDLGLTIYYIPALADLNKGERPYTTTLTPGLAPPLQREVTPSRRDAKAEPELYDGGGRRAHIAAQQLLRKLTNS